MYYANINSHRREDREPFCLKKLCIR